MGSLIWGWISAHPEAAILGTFMIAEKIVRLSPWKKDDILFDMIFKPIMNTMKKKET
jgi:hypothetical protein